jgi:hypothetical protein
MRLASSSPLIFWYRPFFDLGPRNDRGPLPVDGLELAWRALDDERLPPYALQVHLPASFREELLRETGMPQYQVDDPLQLPEALRTERWQTLCDYLTRSQSLTPTTQLRVINVLRSLSLHRAVLAYVPKMAAQEIASDSVLATLSLRRAMSALTLRHGAGLPYNRADFERIGRAAPSGSLAQIGAALQLVAQDAKLHHDISTIASWAEVAATAMQHRTEPLDDFGAALLESVYQRAVAFLPFLRGERDELAEAMERCEAHARHLQCAAQTLEQQLLARENFNIILQSRVKEAIELQDLDAAKTRARQLVEREPFDPLYRHELGAVILQQAQIEGKRYAETRRVFYCMVQKGKIAEAAHAYHAAVQLGPPRTAVAWFYAGQCHQALGELATACTCYQEALRVDPLALSVLERLTTVASQLGEPGLMQWSRRRLAELQKQR